MQVEGGIFRTFAGDVVVALLYMVVMVGLDIVERWF